jgi:hypothetical protein
VIERCTMGISDSIQDANWDVTLLACVREDMSSFGGVGASSRLGHQVAELQSFEGWLIKEAPTQ